MKRDLKLLLSLTAALGVSVPGHAAVTLKQAQITQIVKDVKTIEPGKGSRPAVMKETVQGDQAVRTGIASRTELFFNDRTITRLGANTNFSFKEGTRDLSLQSGAMLLQVPKGIGGAKIETATATAGITGTTILLETEKGYTKLIVLEGECCITPKGGSVFYKAKHKQCATAGQAVILINNSTKVATPVYVNLKLIERTSLLLTGKWGAPLNTGPIIAAANGQGPQTGGAGGGGTGAVVTTTIGKLPTNPPPTTTAPPPAVAPPTIPPPRNNVP